MKTYLSILALVFLSMGCGSSSELQTQNKALLSELHERRADLKRIGFEIAAEHQRLSRSIAEIQLHVADLDRALQAASSEIWGDGSSTGVRLAAAQRALTSLKSEVDILASTFGATQRGISQ